MKAKINGALKYLEDNQATIANCLTLMTSMLEERREERKAAAAAIPASIPATPVTTASTPAAISSTPLPKKRSLLEHLEEVDKLSAHQKKIREDDMFSPNTKDLICGEIEVEKKELLKAAYNRKK